MKQVIKKKLWGELPQILAEMGENNPLIANGPILIYVVTTTFVFVRLAAIEWLSPIADIAYYLACVWFGGLTYLTSNVCYKAKRKGTPPLPTYEDAFADPELRFASLAKQILNQRKLVVDEVIFTWDDFGSEEKPQYSLSSVNCKKTALLDD